MQLSILTVNDIVEFSMSLIFDQSEQTQGLHSLEKSLNFCVSPRKINNFL